MGNLSLQLKDKQSISSVNIEDPGGEFIHKLSIPSSNSSNSSNQLENTSTSKLEKNPSIIEAESGALEIKKYSYITKAIYLSLMAIAGLMGPLASGMNIPALEDIADTFDTDYFTSSLTVTVFLVSISVCPLIWAMLADAYGRKWFTLVSMIIFALSSTGCALSTSIEMLIVMRFFQGLGSSASMVIGIGVVSDIFPKNEMGRAIGLCSVGPLLGPVVGPIIGGYMTEYIGWRSLFYLSAGLGAVISIFVAIFYKETIDPSRVLPPPLIRNNETGKLEFSKSLPNPFSCLTFLKHIDVTLLCIVSCFVFGSYYANSIMQPLVVGRVYNLSKSQVGLTFITIGVGNIFGSIGTGYISDYFVKKYIKNNNCISSPPDLRLKVCLLGSITIIAALLMNGWFINYELPLGAVLFGQFLIGVSMTNIICGISNYFVEVFPAKSSSVYACSSSVRIIFASVASATTPIALKKINVGITFTIYTGLQILGLLILILMIMSGPKIRSLTRN